jgi:hypothetical protein
MASKATNRVLTDRDELRQWVEERSGTPARVKGAGDEETGDPGILRIDFPGYTGEDTLEPISWDEWFRKFDEAGLALIVQDYTASGERSNFNKVVSRETAMAAESKAKSSDRGRSRATASGRQAAKSGRTSTSTGRSTSAGRGKTSRSSSQSRSANRKSTSSSRSSGRATAQKSARGRNTASSRSRSRTASSKGTTTKKRGASVRSISSGSRKSGTTKSRSGQSGGKKAA